MKRIIHMSDLHVGHEDLGDRFRMIVKNLIFEKGDKPDRYVVIISGDLVDDANDFARFGEVQTALDSLRQAGFKKILMVPGNHDYGSGDHGDKKFVPVFKKVFYNEEFEYPRVDVIDGIAFLGLDSMAEELHWYDEFFSQGELGKKQLARLAKALRTKKVKDCDKRVVYLHHHPFDAVPLHELKDSAKLQATLEAAMKDGISIDAILYGHNHNGRVHNGHWGISRCYDAGTATLKKRSKIVSWMPWGKVASAVRIIKLDEPPQSDYVIDLL